MSNTQTPLLAWHFVSADRTLRDGSPLPPVDFPLRHEGPLIPCESGLHASVRVYDALHYAPGPILCRVSCAGEVKYCGDPVDKLVCCERTILVVVDASAMLHEFACWCAEQALVHIPNPDPRSIAAIKTKRRWLRGEATDAELSAARSAAWSAAGSARSAAGSAARSAARSAAQSAAGSAAWSAWSARSAAGSARSAAWSADGSARSAARAAARPAQAAELESRALALIGE